MSLEIVALGHRYGDFQALKGLDLTLGRGEILAVLGPSGSGKTTLLQILAGLIEPSEGEVRLDGRVLSRPGFAIAPEDRQIGLVFQDFALWPHMTVEDTIAFPLTMRRMGAAARHARVEELLATVRLEGLGRRYPHELSGGQRQRVSIARALAPNPGLILLDEPMSNLDARLRERMRLEIAETLRQEGVTAVYVTHDRLEALSVADRIALLEAGRVAQLGTPEEIYAQPASPFVAAFLGPAALVPARVERRGDAAGKALLATPFGTVPTRGRPESLTDGARGFWVVRPEHLAIGDDGPVAGVPGFRAQAVRSAYAGGHWQVELRSPDCPDVTFTLAHRHRIDAGHEVLVRADASRAWFLPAASAQGVTGDVRAVGAR